MRVKLQLVLCSADGREETVTDLVTLQKDSHRLEHLGLTLAEAKQILKRIQNTLVIRKYHVTPFRCLLLKALCLMQAFQTWIPQRCISRLTLRVRAIHLM